MSEDYCTIADAVKPPKADGPPYAECVLCREADGVPGVVQGHHALPGLRVAGGAAHGLLRLTASPARAPGLADWGV